MLEQPPSLPKPFPRKGGDMTRLFQAHELPHKSWCALGMWLLPPRALHRARLLHAKVRDGQGAVSDQGTQLMRSYLPVTGRLFPIVQEGKLRQGGSLGLVEQGTMAVALSWLHHPC